MAEYPGASSPPPTNESRNEDVVPTLRDLSLLPIPNWYLLGLQLGVSGDELDMIERNYPRDNDLCKAKMFGTWLRVDPNATYGKLARALFTLGKRNIAEAMCTARGIPLTVLNDSPAAVIDYLPPSTKHLPKYVTRSTRERSQMLGPSSSTSTQKMVSQSSSSIQRKGSKPTTSTHRAESQKPGLSSYTQKKGSQRSSSTQKKGSQSSSSIQRKGSKPTTSTHRAGSQKPGLSSFAQKKECQPISSTQRAGSWKPGTSSLSNLPKVVSTAAPQTTKNAHFRKAEYSRTSTEGTSVSPVPSSPTLTSTSSSFPYLKVSKLTDKQQEELITRLCVESEDIVDKFWYLYSRVYKSLCERNVSVDKLVTHLLLLDAFDPVHKGSQKPALQTFFQELRNATSIEDVQYIIRDYLSFFNYRVIEHIVDGLGTDHDKTELQNYKQEFDEYSKRRIYESPPVYGSMSKANHAELVLKLDSAYDKFTVKELKKFEHRLSRTLHVSPQSVLRLCRVEEGCLKLIFQVPSFVQQEIFPLSSEQESALAAESVIRLTCGDYQFVTKEDKNGLESENSESVAEPKAPVFQAALTVHDNDADSAMGTSIITDDRSSCRFFEDPLTKELDELDDFESMLQMSSEHPITGKLHFAAWKGNLDTVRFLIDKEQKNPLQKDEYGDTAFHAAALGGKLNVLKYFIDERNCNPARPGHRGRTPLHDAAEHAHLDVIKYLVTEQQVEPLCQDEYGWTPLHLSCKSGSLSIVKFLTEEIEKYKPMRDLMPSLITKNKNTPLHIAALNGHMDVVRFFITDLNCKPNIPGQSDRTLLHYAAVRGHLHIIKYLIEEQECDPSCLKKDKSTPLHVAAHNGHLNIVKYLTLEKQCNPTSRNCFGSTPIHWAAMYGHLEILNFFVALKHSPNITGQSNRTPLHYAAWRGHLHIMKYLINEQGCDPSCLDRNKQTPLHRAAAKGHLDIVKFLALEKHCIPNQRDILKNTPLHTAAVNGHLQVVQFFVEELKCPPNIRGQLNATPHQFAEIMGHHNVALYLQKFQHLNE